MRILQRGDTGNDVRLVQTALIRAGYDPGPVDGIFGGRTETAVKRFQRVLGLREDGIVGSDTWAYLEPFANEQDPFVLRRGSRGSNVLMLQRALRSAGYDPGTLDGLFGTRTQAAVRSFQQSRGLPVTGVVDDTTWFALAPYLELSSVILRRGSSGLYVRILQNALKEAGYFAGAIDGVFGAELQSAVRAFQEDNNLVVDGIVGPRTWEALMPYMSGGVVLYTVQPGDNLTRIARRFNTTVGEILRLNPRSDPNLIYVGEVLRIPVGTALPRVEA